MTLFVKNGRQQRLSTDVIGECVVSGGVRRSALISLSDLHDIDMRDAKQGTFYLTDSHRCVANNSAVYDDCPTDVELLGEWLSLTRSGTGERGLFVRGNMHRTLPEQRHVVNGPDAIYGTNPCGEIILQNKQFCNLNGG